jgi:predicted kinase
MTRRVYDSVIEDATKVVRAGHAAVIDAVFARPWDRDAIETAAETAGVPFVGLWLDAPERVLVDRVRRREADASDADAAIIRAQLTQGAGSIKWTRISGAADAVRREAIAVIETQLNGTGSGRNAAATTCP